MKTITIYLTVLLLSFYMPALQAQEDRNSEKIEELERQKEEIISEEREALRKTVEAVNQRLEKNEITREEATRLKEEAAKKHARNIDNRIATIDNEIEWLSRGEVDVEGREDKSRSRKEKRTSRSERTDSFLVIAAGFNNAIQEGQDLDELEFEEAGSRFFEIGLAWRTRVFENSNWLRIKYGVSFQFNGLKPKHNRYFVQDGEMTTLEEYPVELEKSKFRMDNLVFPLHFEFGPSERADTNWGTWFSTGNRFKMGLGGYAGFNIGERQKLKYEENGEDVKRKLKGSYNTNDLIYGLSAYVGWGATSLYVKYDINPIFDEPNVELNNVSVGLRFDLD